MGASVDTVLAGKTLSSAKEVMQSLASSPVTAAELEQAKNELVTLTGNQLAKPDGVADAWLDWRHLRTAFGGRTSATP